MERLAIPILILIALIGAFLFFASPKKTVTIPDKKPKTDTKTGDVAGLKKQAGEAVDRGAFSEAIDLLKPLQKSDDVEVQATLGYAYSGLQDFISSAEAFEKAISGDRRPELVYSLAYVYQTLGDEVKARPLFLDLSRLSLPPGVQVKVNLGLAKSSAWCGETKAALEAFKKVIKQDPKQVDAFIGLFKIVRTTGNIKDLEDACEAGDVNHDRKFDYNFWKGFMFSEVGNDEKALDAFKKCISINPENSSPYYYLYKILRKSKKIEEALKAIETFYSMNPALPYIFFQAAIDAKKENRLDLSFKFLRSSVLYDRTLLGRNDEGTLSAVQKYVETKGAGDEKAFLSVFMDYVNGDIKAAKANAGMLLKKIKDEKLVADTNRIIRECDRVIMGERAYQEYMAAMQVQAVSSKKPPLKIPTGTSKESPLEAAKREAMANPKDARLQYATALKLAEMGDIEGSKQFLRETIRANPGVSEAYYSLARLSLHEKNSAEAITNLSQALKIRPENSQARSLLASLKLANGEIDQAMEEARAAIVSNPGNPEARFVLAESYMQQQKPEKALEQIDYALEIETDPDKKNQLEAMRKKLGH